LREVIFLNNPTIQIIYLFLLDNYFKF
jgi:hypothetical protein